MRQTSDSDNILSSFFENHHIDVSKGILVAFSGGCDSLCLLILLSKIIPKKYLHAAYVNHHLRPEQELIDEIVLNRNNCAALHIPFSVLDAGSGTVRERCAERGHGIEDAARTVRYELLEQERERLGFSWLATAHTADDQAETVFMKVLQGSGIHGLRGIASVQGSVIRPILSLSRQEVETQVTEAGFSWSEDSTNAQLLFLRNSIRKLIKETETHIPYAKTGLLTLAEKANITAAELDALPNIQFTAEENRVYVKASEFLTASRYQRAQTLYRMHQYLFGDELLSWRKIVHIEKMAQTYATMEHYVLVQTKSDSVFLSDGLLIWEKNHETCTGGWHYEIKPLGPLSLDLFQSLVMKREEVEKINSNEKSIYIDPHMLEGTVVIRNCSPTDTIELQEGERSISALLQTMKIPYAQRALVPVLEDGKGIVAVFASFLGGRDRIATRFKLGTLAPKRLSLYSILEKEIRL